ncbi:DNA binding domain protein, excisionase family [Phocaeicola salanitronis DSM 18170]|uniref:DNA binding domain protein, excisionase family n=1 Tax=Phocaeicola salanitronis (strain DSM 18170 / JCM 13657 / CCUG 60908 / BL78) TaxID=667015 RepID=F0QZI0_PHOSB|nr:helix-turn-helix domain-containing protein [Phocaeicola salanitronis]ADY35125.1 DNA binding domain protein, excisionase family [Phocaeicola salanitronis DSM 18170]
MAKSNIRIKKICEWCGQEFVAQKVTTKYCSHRCANLAYKQAIRAKRIQQEEQRIQIVKSEKPLIDIKDKEYLSIAQAATLLGLSLQAVYKMIYTGHLVAYKLSSRLSFVRQSDIEEMLKRNPYKKRQPKDTLPIIDFYTTNEIKEKFGVKDSWIFHIAKEHNIPRTFNRGKTYWSKKHIDDYFAKKAPDPEIKEWYSTQDMQEKFGMTLTAIYSFVSKNAIPKKKVGIMVYYSKKHVDIAKGLIAPEGPKYYTIAEAMERFNLTRDQLYHYVKYHNIPRIKVGKYTKILRAELDKFFEPPKIE